MIEQASSVSLAAKRNYLAEIHSRTLRRRRLALLITGLHHTRNSPTTNSKTRILFVPYRTKTNHVAPDLRAFTQVTESLLRSHC
mmetsp:Transcript_5177/g.19399  ORF Transcript_5177/g.19399 Transcript_5177/m.19399 type:complete len:84 (-) Transcript_5177:873-1124(-)